MTENPAGIYLHRVNRKNTRAKYEICSKLTIKTPERLQGHRFGVLIYVMIASEVDRRKVI